MKGITLTSDNAGFRIYCPPVYGLGAPYQVYLSGVILDANVILACPGTDLLQGFQVTQIDSAGSTVTLQCVEVVGVPISLERNGATYEPRSVMTSACKNCTCCGKEETLLWISPSGTLEQCKEACVGNPECQAVSYAANWSSFVKSATYSSPYCAVSQDRTEEVRGAVAASQAGGASITAIDCYGAFTCPSDSSYQGSTTWWDDDSVGFGPQACQMSFQEMEIECTNGRSVTIGWGEPVDLSPCEPMPADYYNGICQLCSKCDVPYSSSTTFDVYSKSLYKNFTSACDGCDCCRETAAFQISWKNNQGSVDQCKENCQSNDECEAFAYMPDDGGNCQLCRSCDMPFSTTGQSARYNTYVNDKKLVKDGIYCPTPGENLDSSGRPIYGKVLPFAQSPSYVNFSFTEPLRFQASIGLWCYQGASLSTGSGCLNMPSSPDIPLNGPLPTGLISQHKTSLISWGSSVVEYLEFNGQYPDSPASPQFLRMLMSPGSIKKNRKGKPKGAKESHQGH
jgi:hypothetical protein